MAPSSPLVFDDVVIDFAAHRVVRGGVEQPLEPKAFAVLAVLVGEPGRAFSRDELLDAVWGHRHVTPGVLNRVMTLLRHALGESADTSRYLHTVHGMGYRFDLPQAEASATPFTADGAERRHSERRAIDTSMFMPLRPRLPAKRWRWLLFGSLLLALGAAVWLTRDTGSRFVVKPPHATLVVLPLHVIGGDPDDTALAEGLADELTSMLARVPSLRVTGRDSATQAALQAHDLGELGRRLGVAHALEGSVRSSGQRLRISLRLVDIASKQTLWVQDYDRNLGDFLTLEREVAQSVAQALSLRFDSPPAAATPIDPGRYRRYLAARSLLRYGVFKAKDAGAMFRQLIAEDPNDARAHEGLANALYQQGFGTYEVVALRDEAIAEAQRALQLDPGLADPHGILAEPACRAAQWERCLGLLRRAVDMAPEESLWRSTYAWRLATLGYLRQAHEQLTTALAANPLERLPHYVMGVVLDSMGRHEEAEAHITFGANSPSNSTRWFNAIWRRDYATAERYARAYGDPRWRGSYIAVTAALQDSRRWSEAMAAIEVSERPRDGNLNWQRLLLPKPDVAANLASMESVWKRGFSAVPTYVWSPQLANHRRDPAFQHYLRRNHMIEYWNAHGWPDGCHRAADGSAQCE